LNQDPSTHTEVHQDHFQQASQDRYDIAQFIEILNTSEPGPSGELVTASTTAIPDEHYETMPMSQSMEQLPYLAGQTSQTSVGVYQVDATYNPFTAVNDQFWLPCTQSIPSSGSSWGSTGLEEPQPYLASDIDHQVQHIDSHMYGPVPTADVTYNTISVDPHGLSNGPLYLPDPQHMVIVPDVYSYMQFFGTGDAL
jgi:hypothetical protein